MNTTKWKMAVVALLALAAAAGVQAQSSSVSIYGSIDQYFNHMSSSSGAHINALQDGKDLRSRLGPCRPLAQAPGPTPSSTGRLPCTRRLALS